MSRILVIDDNETMRDGMAFTIKKMGHDVSVCSSGMDGCAAFSKKRYDLVITDLKMCPIDGIEVIRRIKVLDPDAAVIVITAYATVESAVEAMRQGAVDFLSKPFTPEMFRTKVEQGLAVAKLKRDCARLQAHSEILSTEVREGLGAIEAIFGESEPMKALFSSIRKVAPTNTAVLIEGESGTGKELVAKAIHKLSDRADKPFVTVHCAALVETLLESELFGHEKGSFTGAVARKLGRFELADGGTIFLDEIGEINASVQTKLLRVLQQQEFERVGGTRPISVDVRVISATNKNLKDAVAAGTFREDLFYRINVVPLTLPPLRERRGDIKILAEHFVSEYAPKTNSKVRGLTPAALQLLASHNWPGNVRELEHAIEQALIFCEGEYLDADDFPALKDLLPSNARADDDMDGLPPEDVPLSEALDTLERKLLLRAYKKAGGSKAETARILGMKTSSIYYKLEKYGIITPGQCGADSEKGSGK